MVRMTLFQRPNFVLIAALIGLALDKFTTDMPHRVGEVLFISASIVWSYQELTTGRRWFRKLLGLAVLAYVIISLFNKLQ
jgi:hypothetical protein